MKLSSRSCLVLAAPVLALGLALGGCEPTDSDVAVASRESNIVNGQPDSGHPSVGRIGWMCTATLVGYQTVLTAAHCIKGSAQGFTVGDKFYPSSRVVVHPQYRGESDGYNHDVALLRLTQVPPVTPTPLSSRAPSLVSDLILVGYGITAEGKNDPAKRIAKTKVLWVSDDAIGYSGLLGMGATCSGDSGGPSFSVINGREVQVGIHSHHWVSCSTNGWGKRVDNVLSWITTEAQGDVFIDDQKPPAPAAPKVVITSPAAGSTVGADLVVNAEVTTVETIDRVVLLVDGKPRGTLTGGPYVFPVTLAPGDHTLEVQATSSSGSAGSAAIQVTVAKQDAVDSLPPSVEIVSPADRTIVGEQVEVKALISDNTRVARAEVLVNGQIASTLAQPPFNFVIGVPVGTSTVEVRAFDDANNMGRALVWVARLSPEDQEAQYPDEEAPYGETAEAGCSVAAPRQTSTLPPVWLLLLGCIVWRRRGKTTTR